MHCINYVSCLSTNVVVVVEHLQVLKRRRLITEGLEDSCRRYLAPTSLLYECIRDFTVWGEGGACKACIFGTLLQSGRKKGHFHPPHTCAFCVCAGVPFWWGVCTDGGCGLSWAQTVMVRTDTARTMMETYIWHCCVAARVMQIRHAATVKIAKGGFCDSAPKLLFFCDSFFIFSFVPCWQITVWI